MIRKILIPTLFFPAVVCLAQIDPFVDIEALINGNNQSFDSFVEENIEAIDRMDREYEAYLKAELEAFEKFRKEIEVWWGADNFVESTKKD
ncbi:MAG: hypothetical protein LIO79_03980 [Rikenellaceae bacterium]|nr:hypothetical protein [Rikenellaceae bacterium]